MKISWSVFDLYLASGLREGDRRVGRALSLKMASRSYRWSMNTACDRDRRPAATAAHLSRRLRSSLMCTRVLFRNGRHRKTSYGACSLRQAQCASHSIPAASAASHLLRQTHTPRARSIAPTVCASQRASCGSLCGDPYWSTMARWRPLHFERATDGFKRSHADIV